MSQISIILVVRSDENLSKIALRVDKNDAVATLKDKIFPDHDFREIAFSALGIILNPFLSFSFQGVVDGTVISASCIDSIKLEYHSFEDKIQNPNFEELRLRDLRFNMLTKSKRFNMLITKKFLPRVENELMHSKVVMCEKNDNNKTVIPEMVQINDEPLPVLWNEEELADNSNFGDSFLIETSS